MADEKDNQEKTEEPSQYKLEESRKKGQVASSKELSSVLVLSGSILALILSTVYMFETISEFVIHIQSLKLPQLYTKLGISSLANKTIVVMIKCIGPVFLTSMIVGILAQVGQIGFLYAPEVLALKLERLNPVEGFKRLVSLKALFEATKGFFKFLLVFSIAFGILKDQLPQFGGFLQHDFVHSFSYGKMIMLKVFFSIIVGMIIIAIADFAWEKYQYRKKLMMSKQELKEESKERDGNPEVKQKIRMIQREMANKRMIQEVPNADVIVTNPTHISIALKYDMKTMVSPQVIAVGADHLALKIRQVANENDVPIVENVPLARTLYKTVEVGDPVPRALYKAVAEVLAFVYKMKKKKKALSAHA